MWPYEMPNEIQNQQFNRYLHICEVDSVTTSLDNIQVYKWFCWIVEIPMSSSVLHESLPQ